MNSQKEAKETIRLERLTFDIDNVIKDLKDYYSDEFNNIKETTEETIEYKKIIRQVETYELSNDYALEHHTLDGKTIDYVLFYKYEIVMYANTNIVEFVLTTNPHNEEESYIVRHENDPIVDTLFYPIDYDLLELFKNNKVKKNKN